jgi:hypothetical protein
MMEGAAKQETGADMLGCVCSLFGNDFGDVGAVGLGEGMKTNTALQYLEYVDVRLEWAVRRRCHVVWHYWGVFVA